RRPGRAASAVAHVSGRSGVEPFFARPAGGAIRDNLKGPTGMRRILYVMAILALGGCAGAPATPPAPAPAPAQPAPQPAAPPAAQPAPPPPAPQAAAADSAVGAPQRWWYET